jgi:hypothetical protein
MLDLIDKEDKLDMRAQELNDMVQLYTNKQENETDTDLTTRLMNLKKHIEVVIDDFKQVLDDASSDFIIELRGIKDKRITRTYRGILENRRQDNKSKRLQMKVFKNTSRVFKTIVNPGIDGFRGIDLQKFSFFEETHQRIDCVIQLSMEMFACIINEIYVGMKNCSGSTVIYSTSMENYLELKAKHTNIFKVDDPSDKKGLTLYSRITTDEDSSNIKCLVLDQTATVNQKRFKHVLLDDESSDDEPKENELTNGQPLVDV